VKPDNLLPAGGRNSANIDLTKYSSGQVLQSKDRRAVLKEFVPRRRNTLAVEVVAGPSGVQIIKKIRFVCEASAIGTKWFLGR